MALHRETIIAGERDPLSSKSQTTKLSEVILFIHFGFGLELSSTKRQKSGIWVGRKARRANNCLPANLSVHVALHEAKQLAGTHGSFN